MNKAKLVELAEEVLPDIDVDMESVLRTHLELKLTDKLSDRFRSAFYYLTWEGEPRKDHKKDYESVKPILDDCIDKLLGETK
tara:strand:- start:1073 stop:1318 length:246 start_codon:yes stop_codon:yes gene_type:complete